MENKYIKTIPEDQRISKQETDELLYPIFFEAVNSNPFLTSDIRKDIITQWQALKPNVAVKALKMQLLRLEKAHWENLELINREGLRNKILLENEALKEIVINSSVSADKKANSIVLINKLSANVGQLENLAPTVEIRINTSVNEDDLSIRMNKNQTIEGEIDEKE